MKIYTYPKSRSLRVLWALEEMGVNYESIRVDLLNPASEVKS
ncbi:MAG: glutathione S-transferase family protein, partial [Pantoea agglomerans]